MRTGRALGALITGATSRALTNSTTPCISAALGASLPAAACCFTSPSTPSSSSAWAQSGPHPSAWLAGGLATAACFALAPTAHADSKPSMPVSETAGHPLDFDPVTNEHTAKMTMARTAAIEYYQAGRYTQAESKFREALDEARLGFDVKNPHIASAQNNLAEFYRNTGQHAKAEALYKESLALLNSIYGEKHWLYVAAMHNLALSYEASGNLAAAAETMAHVLKLRLQMFGPRHFLYADSMFALGSIHLKQAVGSGDGKEKGGKAGGGWFGRKAGAAVTERQALGMMRDAIALLEDAESVQTAQVLLWLNDITYEYRKRGQVQDALNCVNKAMYHFGNDKGKLQAQASQLSDTLVELLLESGRVKEARDAAAACVTARSQVFGKELAVAQSMLRLAGLEVQLGKLGDPAAAMQYASNAASLAGELLSEYSRAAVSNWLGEQGQDKSLKRIRASHIQGSALKFVAERLSGAGSYPAQQQAAEGRLDEAIRVLEAGVAAASQQMQKLANPKSPAAQAQLEETINLYVELQVLLLDCIDAASQLVSSRGGAGEKLAQLKAKADAVTQSLLA